MKRVSITYAKANLSVLVDEAEAGEVIIITRYGKPVAKMTAVDADLRAAISAKAK
ncbi:MAG: Antitoxin Phd YefM, type toxin-antitoxin system [Caulobacteraceae bacterium]|nr:Antitoxin Phd YefM, type toxin-antitoxin system [Caulobacteraceae bacterium]